MDIKQMLRDAINSEAAKILKEEYGIDFPSNTTEPHISQMVPRCVKQMITLSLRTFGVPEDTLHGLVQTTNGTLGVFVVLVKS